MAITQAYWRRFAELVTGFAHRYRYDIFYRTGWNVVLLQIGFTCLLVCLIVLALSVLYEDALTRVLDTLAMGQSLTFNDSITAVRELEYAKQKNILLAGTGVLVMAAIFGYLITRLALTPTRDALQSQKQFVGNIAHELRTPLSIIKTNTEVALFNKRLDTDTVDTLKSNIEELDRISDIINNLLSMNMLLRPEKIEFGNVDLGHVVDHVIGNLEELAEHKQIEVSIKQSEHRLVWGNASGVEQIVMNIVKNALNYTPVGGRVSVMFEPTFDGQMELTVEDSGPGIDEKDLQKIFEPFYRGDRSRNRKSGGGSGLGLAIVSELIKLHKGRISIKSVLAKGTTVTVLLPSGHVRETAAVEEDAGEVARDFTIWKKKA